MEGMGKKADEAGRDKNVFGGEEMISLSCVK